MKKNLLGKMVITGIISAAMLASTAASTWAADKSDKDVLRVGMECAYAPFNWTQDTDTTPDGSKAEPSSPEACRSAWNEAGDPQG